MSKFERPLKSVSKWKLLLNNFYRTISGHFFTIFIFIFHKTEVQTVILRSLTGLNLNFSKVMTQNANISILGCLHFCILCHNFWTCSAPLKWPSEPQFCKQNGQKWSKNGNWGGYDGQWSSHLFYWMVFGWYICAMLNYLLPL